MSRISSSTSPSSKRSSSSLKPSTVSNNLAKSSRESHHPRSSGTQQPIITNKNPTTTTTQRTNNSTSVSPPTSRNDVPGLKNNGISPAAHSHVYRDSVLSLKDDPFFRSYTTPQSEVLARELRSASRNLDLGDAAAATAVSHKPLTSNMAAYGAAPEGVGILIEFLEYKPVVGTIVNDINIAVIGAEGAGKSTLIQRALGLRNPPASVASSLRMNIENAIYTISLVELDLEAFDITNDRRILWPKQINGVIVPRFDGALILYDVMNSESISDLPQTLNALTQSSIPTIIVATKCENPPNTRQIDTDKMEAVCIACVESRQTSANKPESARNALSAMLRAILTHRSNGEIYSPRRRAASSVHTNTLIRDGRPNSNHSRASSDISLLKGFPPPPKSTTAPSRFQQPLGRSTLSQHAPFTEEPPISDHPAFRNDTLAEMSSAGSTNKDSRPKTEESDAESTFQDQEDIPILQRNDGLFLKPNKNDKMLGVTFDDLVDRLLSQNMSRHDTNFQDIFLCLYRKFAAPGELFAAILQRLEQATQDPSVEYLIKTATQLRVLNVISKWIESYPGDFASPHTSYRLDSFITQLSRNPAFSAAAKELRVQLDTRVMVDDDTGWARSDANVEGFGNSSNTLPPRNNYYDSHDFPSRMESLTVNSEDENDGSSRRPSEVPSTSTNATSHEELLPPPITYHTVEDYEREARSMIPRQTLPLTKIRYHIFMDTSDDDFAEEMTRIDWVMFSSIRIRDLVRHVSLSLDEKEKCRSLANVNRMINHFNHIAKWVSNMVLIRDKAKHRAQMLEKFMRIALKLRLLNNYNGLGAVIAGINGTAIHRLTQTRALIQPETSKRFMRLELLMGNQKSHFAYRLAWENSPMPRIPFIPLHRRDLVSAEEGSRTFIGGGDGGLDQGQRINWRKFEVLGEVVLPVLKSQVVGYEGLRKKDVARDLVLDCRMPVDEEDIYQRSLAVESSSSGNTIGEFGKKKFPWFQK